jgi:hypothetical protein
VGEAVPVAERRGQAQHQPQVLGVAAALVAVDRERPVAEARGGQQHLPQGVRAAPVEPHRDPVDDVLDQGELGAGGGQGGQVRAQASGVGRSRFRCAHHRHRRTRGA